MNDDLGFVSVDFKHLNEVCIDCKHINRDSETARSLTEDCKDLIIKPQWLVM